MIIVKVVMVLKNVLEYHNLSYSLIIILIILALLILFAILILFLKLFIMFLNSIFSLKDFYLIVQLLIKDPLNLQEDHLLSYLEVDLDV